MFSLGPEIERIVDGALAEDVGWGDLTTEAMVPPQYQGKGSLLVKGRGVLAGIEVALLTFLRIDPSLAVEVLVPDGSPVEPSMVVATVGGSMAGILKAERTALNFLGRMSGIASATAVYVQAVSGTSGRIIDTRKTVPGLRLLDKYAVRMGGGKNHRLHLGDGVLIKDNHLEALVAQGGDLADAVQRARDRSSHMIKVEVEVESLEQAREALASGADLILLDNMKVEEMREVVKELQGRVPTEASGGIRLQNVRAIAETGVDYLSVGALTHSVQALDVSLDLVATE
ncbi:MAG: carboxylating nicotinate-nucleotide diphosphorylase [Dehalococcoidia bacterium]